MTFPSFTESFVRIKRKPKLKNPLLVIGLPGVGFVSKLAVDHLVKSSKAEKIATVYSPHFPNQVLAMKSGRLRMFTLGFYFKKFGKRDVVFLRGDLQALTVEGQFEVSAKILEFARDLGCRQVLAMAGYAVSGKKGKPAVFCTSTSKSLFQKITAAGASKPPNAIPIVGMAGLLPSLSKLYGLQGACLLAETNGTAMDSAAAKSLLELISKFAGLGKLDFKPLDERVKKAEKMFKTLEAQQQAGAMPAAPVIQPTAVEKKDALRYIT